MSTVSKIKKKSICSIVDFDCLLSTVYTIDSVSVESGVNWPLITMLIFAFHYIDLISSFDCSSPIWSPSLINHIENVQIKFTRKLMFIFYVKNNLYYCG